MTRQLLEEKPFNWGLITVPEGRPLSSWRSRVPPWHESSSQELHPDQQALVIPEEERVVGHLCISTFALRPEEGSACSYGSEALGSLT